MTLRSRSILTLLVTGLGAAVLAACSGKTDAAPVAEADFATQLAHAVCDNIGPCCAKAQLTYDKSACASSAIAALQGDFDRRKKEGATYDATAAGQCVAQYQGIASSCSNDSTTDTLAACRRVYAGSKALGEACTTTSECRLPAEGSVACWQAVSSNGTLASQGTCVGFRPAQKGDACMGLGALPPGVTTVGDCNFNDKSAFYCDSASICQPRVAIGQACPTNSFGACVEGGQCVDGVCASAPKLGESCTFGKCAGESFCDFSSTKCTAKRKAGEACDQSAACVSGNCSGKKCVDGWLTSAPICAGTREGGGQDDSSSGGG